MQTRRQWAALIAILGVFAYLLRAALAAIFVIAVPLADDWCTEWVTIPGDGNDLDEEVCVEFRSDYEEDKYYHNKAMETRNLYLNVFTLLLCCGVAWFVLRQIPNWKGQSTDRIGVGTVLAVGFLAWLVIPWFLSLVLPPPVDWFPQVFRDIQDAQVDKVLTELKRASHP